MAATTTLPGAGPAGGGAAGRGVAGAAAVGGGTVGGGSAVVVVVATTGVWSDTTRSPALTNSAQSAAKANSPTGHRVRIHGRSRPRAITTASNAPLNMAPMRASVP